MAEYIELINKLRQEAEWEAYLQPHSQYETPKLLSKAADVIEKLSKERKNGKWEYRAEFFAYGIAHFDCSICGESVLERTYFCPNCGADMR